MRGRGTGSKSIYMRNAGVYVYVHANIEYYLLAMAVGVAEEAR